MAKTKIYNQTLNDNYFYLQDWANLIQLILYHLLYYEAKINNYFYF